MALPASTLVTYACQIARVPGFTTQGGDFLNMILQMLAQDFDWEPLLLTTTIGFNLGSTGPYNLPANYLRTRPGLFSYNVQGEQYVMQQIDLAEFNRLFISPGVTDYPREFATDTSSSPATLQIYPQSSIAVNATLRYYSLPADIASPASSNTVPWFPNQKYLLMKLVATLCSLASDDRAEEFEAKAEKLLGDYIKMERDDEGYAQRIQLDGRLFRSTKNLRPTKLTVW